MAKLYLSYCSDVYQEITSASMSNDESAVRKLNFHLDRAITALESWVLLSRGTMIQSGGHEGSFELPSEKLGELLGELEKFVEVTESPISCGVGTELAQSEIALKVAKKRGGNPSIVLYTPEISQELQEKKDELADILDSSLDKSDIGNRRPGEATKIERGRMSPDHAQMSPPSPVTPGSPIEVPEDPQPNQPQGQDPGQDQLIQAVGQVLQDVKSQLPTIESMKQNNPQAYASILDLVQAVIALAQKIGGQGDNYNPEQNGEAQQDSVQKAELEDMFALGVEIETKEHPSVSREGIEQLVRDHLNEDPNYYAKESKEQKTEIEPEDKPQPVEVLDKMRLPEQKPPPAHHHLILPPGSEHNKKIKVVHSNGNVSWVSVRSGMVTSKDGTPVSPKSTNR